MRGMDKTTAVTATGWYTDYADENKNNSMLARNVEVTLPEIEYGKATIDMMGEIDIPIQERVGNMELEIKKIGDDIALARSLHPGIRKWEIRYLQRSVEDSKLAYMAVKVFVKGIITGVPSMGVKPGETIEGGVKMNLFRYQKFVEGIERVLIDRENYIVRINGVDITKDERNYMG